MPRLNSDVAERVLEELKELNGATTTFATTCSETARVLHGKPELWKSPFNFFAIPKKAQTRLVHESMCTCFDRTYRMLRCVSRKFYHMNFMDGCDEDWHWAYCIKNYRCDIPDSPARSWSVRSEDSYVWSPISRSGSSSSGSDDEDLLEKCKARVGAAGKAME